MITKSFCRTAEYLGTLVGVGRRDESTLFLGSKLLSLDPLTSDPLPYQSVHLYKIEMRITSAGIILLAILSLLASTTYASMSYECWSYKGGDLGKMTRVTADSKNEAQTLAKGKFQDIGVSFDEVKCK